MIRVLPSLLGLSSYTAAWIICTCIIRFTFKPLINIDFSVTLRCFTWQLFKTTKLLYDINIDFSRRLPPNYHKKWLLTKKTKTVRPVLRKTAEFSVSDTGDPFISTCLISVLLHVFQFHWNNFEFSYFWTQAFLGPRLCSLASHHLCLFI